MSGVLSKIGRCSSKYPVSSANVAEPTLRALRANRVFCADKKRIRTENTVMYENQHGFSSA